jgi:hypothetical protein
MGCFVGLAVEGTGVGFFVGETLGLFVGGWVGCLVGAAVTGCDVGFEEGLFVGDGVVGFMVRLSVMLIAS